MIRYRNTIYSYHYVRKQSLSGICKDVLYLIATTQKKVHAVLFTNYKFRSVADTLYIYDLTYTSYLHDVETWPKHSLVISASENDPVT